MKTPSMKYSSICRTSRATMDVGEIEEVYNQYSNLSSLPDRIRILDSIVQNKNTPADTLEKIIDFIALNRTEYERNVRSVMRSELDIIRSFLNNPAITVAILQKINNCYPYYFIYDSYAAFRVVDVIFENCGNIIKVVVKIERKEGSSDLLVERGMQSLMDNYRLPEHLILEIDGESGRA